MSRNIVFGRGLVGNQPFLSHRPSRDLRPIRDTKPTGNAGDVVRDTPGLKYEMLGDLGVAVPQRDQPSDLQLSWGE